MLRSALHALMNTGLLVLALSWVACAGADDVTDESTTGATTTADPSTGAASSDTAADTGPCGTCEEKFDSFLGLSNPPPALCEPELVAWSNLELCLIDCDVRFPAPDDEGFCACIVDECADLLDACGEGAAAVCRPGGTTGSADTTGA